MASSTFLPQIVRTEQVAVRPTGNVRMRGREKYKGTLYQLGITEVALGGVSFVLWLSSIVIAATAPPRCEDYGYHSYPYRASLYCYARYFGLTYASAGLWCGAFLFIVGGLGICTKKKPSVCMYNANMAMSIIASVMMGVLMIMSITSAGVESYSSNSIIIPHALLAIVALGAMIICIVHSAYCCAGNCCQRKQNSEAVVYTATPQQYLQLANGQFVLCQGQPTVMTAPPYVHALQPTVRHVAPAPMTVMSSPVGAYPPVSSIPGNPLTAQNHQPPPATNVGVQSSAASAKRQEAESHPTSRPPSYNGLGI